MGHLIQQFQGVLDALASRLQFRGYRRLQASRNRAVDVTVLTIQRSD